MLAGQVAQRLVPAGLGRQQVHVVGHRGLGQHQGHVTGLERRPQRGRVVELGDPHPAGDALGQAALDRAFGAVLQVDQALLEVAVVVTLEQHDHVAPGDRPGQPDGLGVGLGGGQRELPLGHRVAAGELLGHHDRGLGRQQELGGPRHLGRRRGHDHRVRMPAEHGHVRGVEVDVAEPVDVGEAGAPAVVDVDRLVVVGGHPGHRRAVGHVRPGAADHGQRPGPGLAEARQLPGVQLADPGPVKITLRGHTRMLERLWSPPHAARPPRRLLRPRARHGQPGRRARYSRALWFL